MKIIKVINDEEKKKITRAILESLPEWFGILEAREEYILDSVGKDFFCAMEKDKVVGFLYLKQTGKDTVELAVMGVLKEYHRKGIGRALFEYAKESVKESGYSFIQVKTVKMGMYENYDRTNRFYISLGFKEFEVLNSLWDENNPCQIFVMGIWGGNLASTKEYLDFIMGQLSNLEEIDLEIISLKKQILGAKEEISALKSQKENLQLSLGVEIEETIETEDEEDVDLDLSLP